MLTINIIYNSSQATIHAFYGQYHNLIYGPQKYQNYMQQADKFTKKEINEIGYEKVHGATFLAQLC